MAVDKQSTLETLASMLPPCVELTVSVSVAPKINVSRKLLPFLYVIVPRSNTWPGATSLKLFPVNVSVLLLLVGDPQLIAFVPKPVKTPVAVLSTGISVLPSKSITAPLKTGLEKIPEMLPLLIVLARASGKLENAVMAVVNNKMVFVFIYITIVRFS